MCNGYWYECDCEDCNRAKELHDDIKYYWDDIKTEGIVFWIYFLIIGGTFGITLYGFINSFNYYLNYIKK